MGGGTHIYLHNLKFPFHSRPVRHQRRRLIHLYILRATAMLLAQQGRKKKFSQGAWGNVHQLCNKIIKKMCVYVPFCRARARRKTAKTVSRSAIIQADVVLRRLLRWWGVYVSTDFFFFFIFLSSSFLRSWPISMHLITNLNVEKKLFFFSYFILCKARQTTRGVARSGVYNNELRWLLGNKHKKERMKEKKCRRRSV